VTNAGVVHVIYGSSTGLSTTVVSDRVSQQALNGIQGAAEAEDRIGIALAVGDFDNNGRQDVAIGCPNEDINSPTLLTDAGAVMVLYSIDSGVSATNNQLFTQSNSGAVPAAREKFGAALAPGNFNGPGPFMLDNFSDLMIGTPGETVTGFTTAGVVTGLTGSASRLVRIVKPTRGRVVSED